MAIMARVLNQHLVGYHRTPHVVEAIALAQRVAFDVVEGEGIHHCPRRPESANQRVHPGDHLRRTRRIRTVRTTIFSQPFQVGVVAGDHPGARDRVFA